MAWLVFKLFMTTRTQWLLLLFLQLLSWFESPGSLKKILFNSGVIILKGEFTKYLSFHIWQDKRCVHVQMWAKGIHLYTLRQKRHAWKKNFLQMFDNSLNKKKIVWRRRNGPKNGWKEVRKWQQKIKTMLVLSITGIENIQNKYIDVYPNPRNKLRLLQHH